MSGHPAYTLDDPRPIAAEAPYTFFLPSSAELAALEQGDLAKLIFRPTSIDSQWDAERMWVEIQAVDDEIMTGRLDSEPDDFPGLHSGDLVTFQRHHVVDCLWSESRRTPPPPPPPRQDYWDRCLVDRCVTEDKVPVHFLYREEPETPEEDDRYPDSGWHIRGDYRALSDAEIDAREVEYVALGRVLNADDSWLHLIDAPIGSAFFRNWETGDFEAEEA